MLSALQGWSPACLAAGLPCIEGVLAKRWHLWPREPGHARPAGLFSSLVHCWCQGRYALDVDCLACSDLSSSDTVLAAWA